MRLRLQIVRLRSFGATAGLVVLLLAMGLPVVAGQFGRFFLPPTTTVEYDSRFAFTRIRYGTRTGGNFGWEHDYPQADRNFAAILDYMTHMRVNLNGSNILDLDDPRIFQNPVIYLSEPGGWTTDDAEATNLRKYLLKGGFIIFDDFDGEPEWRNLVRQMRVVLPDHEFIQLDVSHPIFQSFFSLRTLNVPHPMLRGIEPVFYGLFDDNSTSGRMMAIANFNNDIGDYWEWSAEGLYGDAPTADAYRLGVNYLVYEMTH
ncbi:MAG TPA: DUF4159 domain-containing protein [Vicinamibacterales bacterium]|nr:DUF4159 domain-containing protein [Vicinamibacterales bacterium]